MIRVLAFPKLQNLVIWITTIIENGRRTSSLQSRTNCLRVLRSLSMSKSDGLYVFVWSSLVDAWLWVCPVEWECECECEGGWDDPSTHDEIDFFRSRTGTDLKCHQAYGMQSLTLAPEFPPLLSQDHDQRSLDPRLSGPRNPRWSRWPCQRPQAFLCNLGYSIHLDQLWGDYTSPFFCGY